MKVTLGALLFCFVGCSHTTPVPAPTPTIRVEVPPTIVTTGDERVRLLFEQQESGGTS